jgi:cobyrinic acid a,c-diamide synthase
MNKFLIGAPSSGCGKTTITLGLMQTMRHHGLRVQPFKCGPDYIDTKFHSAVCGRPSINLDTFMATPEHVRELFEHYGADADVCVVEGMMGLFDGYDRWRGSTAEIARLLDIPILLVVNARSMAYSAAAIIKGFTTLWDDLRFAGVLFNQVGSDRHVSFLRQSCADVGIPCVGCLPRVKELSMPSRHLGLSLEHRQEIEQMICYAAELIENHVDYNLLEI